ncbi:YcjX family protein [Salinarimonas chemoclinalis]|uniref:YcjX family protein n=1 Tax=Salinarimonas chemoclinalis TaxID=3241599 RepID=UPI003556E9EE
MPAPSFASSAFDVLASLGDYASRTVDPGVRIGVTGLARSGKTVFTTALVHNLVQNVPLPAFRASHEGRIRRARLAAQPDDAVPRFAYEDNLRMLAEERRWPASTSRVSELRVDIDYERGRGAWRSGPARLHLDIVDYPGEWLLDLALLDQDFGEWSREVLDGAARPDRAPLAAPFLAALAAIDPDAEPDEPAIAGLSAAFKDYLVALRAGPEAVATTPPGRFLMPGDLEGSPALTFAPLRHAPGARPKPRSLGALMERRFESYRHHVVRPFFREHFQRIDRQIVLVDVLAAIDGGAGALAELERALDRVLLAFRSGRNTLVSRLFAPRAERVLFAATKADHVHQTSHARLEAVLRLLVERAVKRGEAAGAKVGTVALASVRATLETLVHEHGTRLEAVAGVPEAGETIDGAVFDGNTRAAVFPGELPERAAAVLEGAVPPGSLRFPRFRPPEPKPDPAGRAPRLPHIRLDRAIEFLIGDRLA